MTSKKAFFFCFVFVIFFVSTNYAQNSVGINTASPNNNAVLELVSPNNNQGFLLPRLTTAQRTDDDFVDNLTEMENGLIVYDTDENCFFYWLNNEWIIGLGAAAKQTENINVTFENICSGNDFFVEIDTNLIFSPEQIIINENGLQSVSYTTLITALLQTIKNQQTLIETQQYEIEKLELNNDRLLLIEKQVDILQKQIEILQTAIENN